MKQHRDLEAIDQHLGVLRRRAADHDARVAERDLQVDHAGHRGQRAHHVVAGAGDALQLGALEHRRAGRGRRSLAGDLDRLVLAARLEQDHVVEPGRGHRGQPRIVAVVLDHQARADRRRDPEPAVAIGLRGLAAALDADRRVCHRLAERIDHPAGDRRGRQLRGGRRARGRRGCWFRRRFPRVRDAGSRRDHGAHDQVAQQHGSVPADMAIVHGGTGISVEATSMPRRSSPRATRLRRSAASIADTVSHHDSPCPAGHTRAARCRVAHVGPRQQPYAPLARRKKLRRPPGGRGRRGRGTGGGPHPRAGCGASETPRLRLGSISRFSPRSRGRGPRGRRRPCLPSSASRRSASRW